MINVDDIIKYESDILVSPNPAKNQIIISYKNPLIQTESIGIRPISIYNILGECVIKTSSKPQASNPQIDVSDLPAGVYFVVINSGNEIKRGMFVKE